MARVYANENFPFSVVEELRRLGHDVVTSLESGNAGRAVPDPEVLAFAVSRQRVLVTLNCRHSNSQSKTHHVGQKSPNAWGLYDLLGNVWEWCADWYDEEYYASSPAADPPGASGASYRVIRGGSWDDDDGYCRLAYRRGFAPEFRITSLGFRVAAVQG